MFDFDKALQHYTRFPEAPSRICGVDTETTGTHLHHDSRPFMVSFTYNDGESILYTAEVDPMTRIPAWQENDLEDIRLRLADSSVLTVMSNAKFDTRALGHLVFGLASAALCSIHDTILQHHCLNNDESHGLKDAAVKYAKIPDTDESELHEASKAARTIAKRLGWAVASKTSCPQQRRAPSARKSGWAVMDMWLPRAVAKHNWETSVTCSKLKRCYYENEIESLKGCTDPIIPTPPTFEEWLEWPENPFIDLLKGEEGYRWHPPSFRPESAHPWWTLCGKYCSFDTLRSVVLHQKFVEALQEQGLLKQYLENRTSLPLSYEMEQHGVSINVDTAKGMITTFRRTMEAAAFALNAALNLPLPINPSSSKALRGILYGYFQLPVTRLTKPKKESSVPQPTTDANYISDLVITLADEALSSPEAPTWHKDVEPYKDFKKRLKYWYQMLISEEKPSRPQLYAFAKHLLMYKKAEKAISQLEGYLHSAIPLSTNYAVLHPSFNPIGTKTTRYSSSNPNGQNISKGGRPKKGMEWLEMSKNSLRSVFCPLPGFEWWSFDYSQIELVIFAILSGDDKMIEAVYRGEHFHRFIARIMTGKPTNDLLTEAEIDNAKQANFCFVYGGGEEKLSRSTGVEGLYRLLGNHFPTAFDFLQKTEWEVRQNGFVMTAGGTRLYVPETKPHAGVNYKCQGSAGEVIKRAMYGIGAFLEKKRIKDYNLIMQVHDDLIYNTPRNNGYAHCGSVLRIMQDAGLSYGFPVKVQPKLITDNWGEAKKIVVV